MIEDDFPAVPGRWGKERGKISWQVSLWNNIMQYEGKLGRADTKSETHARVAICFLFLCSPTLFCDGWDRWGPQPLPCHMADWAKGTDLGGNGAPPAFWALQASGLWKVPLALGSHASWWLVLWKGPHCQPQLLNLKTQSSESVSAVGAQRL